MAVEFIECGVLSEVSCAPDDSFFNAGKEFTTIDEGDYDEFLRKFHITDREEAVLQLLLESNVLVPTQLIGIKIPERRRKCMSLKMSDYKFFLRTDFFWSVDRDDFHHKCNIVVSSCGAQYLSTTMANNLSIDTGLNVEILTGNGLNVIERVTEKRDGYATIFVKAKTESFSEYFVFHFDRENKSYIFSPTDTFFCFPVEKVYYEDKIVLYTNEYIIDSRVHVGRENYAVKRNPILSPEEVLTHYKEKVGLEGFILMIEGREYKVKVKKTHDVLLEGKIVEVWENSLGKQEILRERFDKERPDSIDKMQRCNNGMVVEDLARKLFYVSEYEKHHHVIVPSHGLMIILGAQTGLEFQSMSREIFGYMCPIDQVAAFDKTARQVVEITTELDWKKMVKNGFFRMSTFFNWLRNNGIPFIHECVFRELILKRVVYCESDATYVRDLSNVGQVDFKKFCPHYVNRLPRFQLTVLLNRLMYYSNADLEKFSYWTCAFVLKLKKKAKECIERSRYPNREKCEVCGSGKYGVVPYGLKSVKLTW